MPCTRLSKTRMGNAAGWYSSDLVLGPMGRTVRTLPPVLGLNGRKRQPRGEAGPMFLYESVAWQARCSRTRRVYVHASELWVTSLTPAHCVQQWIR